MNTIKQIQRLKKIHQLIKLETTGNPKELALRMRVSERQVYLILEQLKEMEAPIRFNRKSNTYYYENDFELLVNISVQVIQKDQLLNIYAGQKILRNIIGCKVPAVCEPTFVLTRQN